MTELAGTPPVRAGIVGCGNIFGAYARGLRKLRPVRVAGCADIDQDRAERAAKSHGLRAYESVDALLDDDSVRLVVNITPPLAHATVTLAGLGHGKHVFVEKPVAASLAEAAPVMAAVGAGSSRLGCAPDTFLAGPGQTARAALDSGLIGEPIGAAAAIPHSRVEEWHPDPGYLFRRGGGPLLDMGPYYLAALVHCLGPVRAVSGAARIGTNPRVITAPGRLVDTVQVEVPTHEVAVLTFASGVVGTLTASFDIWSEHLPHIEIYGSRGMLRVPDPDKFDGDVTIRLNDGDEWQVLPPVLRLDGWTRQEGVLRGLGTADLAESLAGRPQRTTAELGYHVLEVIESIATASARQTVVSLTSSPARPEPVAPGDLGGMAVPGGHDQPSEQRQE